MKRFFQFTLGINVFFGVITSVNKVRYNYDWGNAFWRTLMTPVTKTIWAKDYSEAAFAKVKHGMSSFQVLALVGDPLQKKCDQDGCGWRYSDQVTSTADSDRRWVRFDAKDRVVEIWHEFHID